MARSRSEPLWIIGWREWLALPDLGIPAIKVKVDTGARTSALHAFDVEIFRRDGRSMARFGVQPLQRDSSHRIMAEAELIGERRVRSSGGHPEERPVVRTRAALLGREWTLELTLTNRDEMGFRMLLGREALRRRFIVDPGRSFLAGKPAKPLAGLPTTRHTGGESRPKDGPAAQDEAGAATSVPAARRLDEEE